jgi:glycerophosphoryl diester phosphodiesterase
MGPVHPYLDHPGPIPFAHRGGTDVAPENSMAAFQHARSLGYRYLETDAHLTADGVIVSFHDPKLDRVTDATGAIADLPWTAVASARMEGGHRVPTMDQLFDEFPDARFNIDTKSDQVVAPLADFLLRRNALDQVCVGSFSDDRLATIRKLCGDKLCSSRGVRAIVSDRLRSTLRRPVAVNPQCVQIPVRHLGVKLLDEAFMKAARRAGVPVHVWTINDAEEMNRLLDLGVDGLMTDRTELLKEVFESRGLWSS